MKPKLTPGNAVILAAGLVMLLGSFLPFYSGFGVTVSTSYEHPSAMACKCSAVNQSSNGRVTWNIVTTYLDSAARNCGPSTQSRA